MKTATHEDLIKQAELLMAATMFTADHAEALRLLGLRSFTRKDKESLSTLARKYLTHET